MYPRRLKATLRRPGRTGRAVLLASGLVTALVLAGCSGQPSTTAPPAPSGPAGASTPTPQVNCTSRATDGPSLQQALAAASAGDTICVNGDLGDARLEIDKGGSEQSPIHILGDGRTMTKGITVAASNVVVDGFVVEQPRAPGASLKGSQITLQNTIINSPRRDDGDGIRFWGDNIKILHNTITDTRNDRGAHADCMQTFATDEDSPASQNVLIDGNRCDRIANNCLIVEGPNSSAGDGSGQGVSENITFSNNYCDNDAAQAVLVDDAQHVTISGNQIVAHINHAFALQNEATNAVIRDNTARSVKYEVGMDSSSRPGYQGPEPGGAP